MKGTSYHQIAELSDNPSNQRQRLNSAILVRRHQTTHGSLKIAATTRSKHTASCSNGSHNLTISGKRRDCMQGGYCRPASNEATAYMCWTEAITGRHDPWL